MGIGAVATGIGIALYGIVDDPSENLYMVGGLVFCVGAGLEITSIINGVNKKKRMKKIVNLYNANR